MKPSLLFAAFVPCLLGAAQLTPTGYSYDVPPDSGFYSDSGGIELTDGITYSLAWGGAAPIGPADIVNLVGWQSSPTATFTFATPVTIRSVSVYFADSDGAAGVGMPSSVTLSDGAGFSQFFPVTNPAGAGSTVESVFSGFEVTTSSFSVTVARAQTWVMMSEVQFFDTAAPVPEPASGAALAGLAALGFLASRRRRQA